MPKRKHEDDFPEDLPECKKLADEYLQSPEYMNDELQRLGFRPQKRARTRATSDPLCYLTAQLGLKNDAVREPKTTASPVLLPTSTANPMPDAQVRKRTPTAGNLWYDKPFQPDHIAGQLGFMLTQVHDTCEEWMAHGPDPFAKYARDKSRFAFEVSKLRRINQGMSELREFLEIGPVDWSLTEKFTSQFLVDVHSYVNKCAESMEALFGGRTCAWERNLALSPTEGVLVALEKLRDERRRLEKNYALEQKVKDEATKMDMEE